VLQLRVNSLPQLDRDVLLGFGTANKPFLKQEQAVVFVPEALCGQVGFPFL